MAGQARASPLTTESDLAAASSGLLAQPRLWQGLRLPAATAALADRRPWTAYWAVRRDGRLAPASARHVLAVAQARFSASGDWLGQALAMAALIETFYVEEGSLQPMDMWIERLESLLPADGAWPSPEAEAQVMACGLAINLRAPTHPLLARWAQRGGVLVRQLAPGASRVKLATFLIQHHLWRGDFARTALIVDVLPGMDPAGVLPAEALAWHESVATHARFAGDLARGRHEIDAALAIAGQHGLDQHHYALHAHGAALAIAAADAAAAQTHLDAMRPELDTRVQEDQTHYWHFHAGLSMLRGDAAAAVEFARMALANSLEIGGPYRTAAHRFSLGQAQAAHQLPLDALASFDQALADARSVDAGLLVHSIQLMRAEVLSQLGRAGDAVAAAGDAFAAGARHGYRTTAGWWLPGAMSRVAGLALKHGIETEYVRQWVRTRFLPCPDDPPPDWPWRVAVRSFGGLHVVHDGQAHRHDGGKAARRPLDLLAAVVSQAPAALSASVAQQWLWPDASDAAARRKAFDVALMRLRRLLGGEHLLRLDGGRLSLDPGATWTDVGELAVLAAQCPRADAASPAAQRAWAARLLDLMRGPFLAESDAPWAEAARQHLRQRVALVATQLVDALAPHSPDDARRLLERALDLDPGLETLARRLIELHAAAGDLVAAQRVLRMTAAMVHLQTGLPLSPALRGVASRWGLSGG